MGKVPVSELLTVVIVLEELVLFVILVGDQGVLDLLEVYQLDSVDVVAVYLLWQGL
jgi:hypothetical protein